jgi:hypothetical protein
MRKAHYVSLNDLHMHCKESAAQGFRGHSEKVEPQRQPFASRQATKHVGINNHAFVFMAANTTQMRLCDN